MPKQKKLQSEPIAIKTLEELIKDYDRLTLVKALEGLKSNIGWQILRAALMKEYLVHVPIALDHSSKTGKQIEASYEAGVSQTLFDVANSVIEKYAYMLENNSAVTQTPRPPEE